MDQQLVSIAEVHTILVAFLESSLFLMQLDLTVILGEMGEGGDDIEIRLYSNIRLEY